MFNKLLSKQVIIIKEKVRYVTEEKVALVPAHSLAPVLFIDIRGADNRRSRLTAPLWGLRGRRSCSEMSFPITAGPMGSFFGVGGATGASFGVILFQSSNGLAPVAPRPEIITVIGNSNNQHVLRNPLHPASETALLTHRTGYSFQVTQVNRIAAVRAGGCMVILRP